MQTGIIYQVFNKISQKSYIGQTTRTLEARKQQHLSSTIKDNYKFANALNKYKKEDWQWSVLALVNVNELDEYEKFFINDLDTYKNGYNSHPGGNWLGENNPRHNEDFYELWHPEYGLIKKTYHELLQISDSFNHLPELIKGKRNQIAGYVLPKNKENYNNIFKIYKFYNPKYGTLECTAQQLFDTYKHEFKSKKCNVYELTNKKIKIYYGWVLEENKNEYEDLLDKSEAITLQHKTHGIKTLKISEWKKQFKLTDSGISFLKSGRNKSTKGWKLLD